MGCKCRSLCELWRINTNLSQEGLKVCKQGRRPKEDLFLLLHRHDGHDFIPRIFLNRSGSIGMLRVIDRVVWNGCSRPEVSPLRNSVPRAAALDSPYPTSPFLHSDVKKYLMHAIYLGLSNIERGRQQQGNTRGPLILSLLSATGKAVLLKNSNCIRDHLPGHYLLQ